MRPLLWGLGALTLIGLVALVVLQRQVAEPSARYAPIYFAALGVGFITIEIALIRQTRLFLGHPTLAVTTILAVLLIGGGLGSGLAGRWADQQRLTRLLAVILAIVILVLLRSLIWPWLSQRFQDSQTFGRLLIASVSVLPLAVLLGIPFPLGLWFVGQIEAGDRHVALGWAVNGVMTVVGSALAIAVTILAGFSSVPLVGAGAYAMAMIFVYLAARRSNLERSYGN